MEVSYLLITVFVEWWEEIISKDWKILDATNKSLPFKEVLPVFLYMTIFHILPPKDLKITLPF